MKDIFLFFATSACVLGIGVLYARRARAAGAGAPSAKFAPLGFAWNDDYKAYTRVNRDGEIEVYAQDVYL